MSSQSLPTSAKTLLPSEVAATELGLGRHCLRRSSWQGCGTGAALGSGLGAVLTHSACLVGTSLSLSVPESTWQVCSSVFSWPTSLSVPSHPSSSYFLVLGPCPDSSWFHVRSSGLRLSNFSAPASAPNCFLLCLFPVGPRGGKSCWLCPSSTSAEGTPARPAC